MTNIKYRMEAPCVDCPFNTRGPGAELRESLRDGRFKEITDGLKKGNHFICHKTECRSEYYDPDDDYAEEAASVAETMARGELLCAGAIEWQSKRGIKSEYLEICERLFGEQG